ncbi:MAG: glycosyltransferase, partial [Calditrichota bacterium]
LRWAMHRTSSPGILPTISVIVVGRNEEWLIRPCLESLIRLDYPHDKLELCYVDDHSTDGTLGIGRKIAEGSSNLTVHSAPPCPTGIGPKKNALAHGISQTSGEILMFTDADCVVQPGWVKALLETYTERTGAVAGATVPQEDSLLSGKLYRLERLLVHYTSASAIGWGSPASVSGTNFSYRRCVYDQIGGIAHADFPSGDDDLMAQAIHRQGWEIGFAQGTDSVVTDMRPFNPFRMVRATIRHQSTIRFYPWFWRIAYIATILSYGLLIGVCFLALLSNQMLFVLILTALGLRAILDGWGLKTFIKPLRIHVSVADFIRTELLLPLFSIVRPLLAIVQGFSWKDRIHRSAHHLTTETLS